MLTALLNLNQPTMQLGISNLMFGWSTKYLILDFCSHNHS